MKKNSGTKTFIYQKNSIDNLFCSAKLSFFTTVSIDKIGETIKANGEWIWDLQKHTLMQNSC